jgi:formiminotetrahydrofolate cyclodeaminase
MENRQRDFVIFAASEIHNHAMRRRLIQIGEEMAAAGRAGIISPSDIALTAINALVEVETALRNANAAALRARALNTSADPPTAA